MRFDDRLATVLNQPVQEAHDRAVRWRQLVDLVARSAGHEHSPMVAAALELIQTDAGFVSDSLRAAAARAIAAPTLPLELLRYFVREKLSVAAPVLAAVQLSDDEWRQLIADSEPEVRRFILTLRPGLEGTPPPAEPPPAAAAHRPAEPEVEPSRPAHQPFRPAHQPPPTAQQPPPQPAPPPAQQHEPTPTISEVIARIERLRHAREQHPTPAATPSNAGQRSAAPASPSGSTALFRWECEPSGEIAWVEGAPRGALIGRSIARREGTDGVDEQVERAFAMRAPFRDATLQLAGEGAVAGEWKISGIPAFSGGRFAGYRGVAVRESRPQPAPAPASLAAADPDSLRELVHELKTPLNAIIGFAEIIDGQILGPADRPYRERAAEIVKQARLLLAAIDDLDFTAKLQADGGRQGGGAELNGLLDSLFGALREHAATRGVTVEVRGGGMPAHCPLDASLAERLVWRFCHSAIDRAPTGEVLQISVQQRSGASCVVVTQRRELAQQDSAFDLRLVRGLARMVGGDVTIENGSVVLSLPGA